MLPDWATRAWAHFAEEKRVGEEFRFSFLSIASIESHLQQHSSTLSNKVVKAGWTVNYVTIHETQKNTVKIYSGAKKAPMEARAIEVAKGRVFGFPSLPHLSVHIVPPGDNFRKPSHFFASARTGTVR
eukprot:4849336-Lingulodinium_polyedra.AAC.1